MKFSIAMHKIKDNLHILPQFRTINYKIGLRGGLVTVFFILLFTILGFSVCHVFLSLAFFFICLSFTLIACMCSFFHKGWVRNAIFFIIFSIGILCYSQMNVTRGNTTFPSNSKIAKKLLPAIHHSNTALAAFFPSRGSYEVTTIGKDTNDKTIQYSEKFMWCYLGFHAAAYMFAGYFIMLLWGYRTVNRLRFFLTRNTEKCVFWCITPSPKMLKLATDILENAKESAQPVFSVEETAYDDQKPLFHEMTFQKFCLKFRKPSQIHKKCLWAARHFFLSEDSDWNISMAESLLKNISKLKVKTQLYIRINNDARKIYYIRWAEQRKSSGVEIIFIDECALIVDKFTHDHHILDSFKECIGENATVNKKNGFRFLLIGFGGLGQEVLKHLVCDTCFLDVKGNSVPIQVDIIEKDAERIALFQKQYAEFCKNFSIDFIQNKSLERGNLSEDKKNIAAGTAEFYSFFEQYYQQYDRIVVALGDAALNIENIARIENIIRKNIDLSSSDPQEELEKWKSKLFLISPELCSSIYECNKNIFTLIGANNEIFNYSDIINEKLFYAAKLISYRHNGGSVADAVPADVEKNWLKQDFYSRQSSYAAALGLENTKLLLKKNTDAKKYIGGSGVFTEKFIEWFKPGNIVDLRENLGKIEHLRWWAFMLCCGYICWDNPQKNKNTPMANQTEKYLRHATMIKWDELSIMDKIFPDRETFKEKDLKIIDNLPFFYVEEDKNVQ